MHELSINRLIAAPPETVWDVMVNRQEEWWCPKPWRAIITAQDKRPGGVCDMVMHGPDGEVMQHRGIYLAYEEGKRFAVTDAVTGDLEPSGPFMIGIWSIEPEGSGTLHRQRPPLDRGSHAPASGDGLYPGLGRLRGPVGGFVRNR
jgi:uncharacterized protein YndB with AHSA1/START domain